MNIMTKRENIQRLLKLIAIAFASGVTIFTFMLLFFQTEALLAMLLSSTVIGGFGLMIGGVCGFIGGAISGYCRGVKECSEELNTELEKKDAEIIRLNQQVTDARSVIKLLKPRSEAQKAANENRASKIFNQISGLSQEVDTTAVDETLEEETNLQEEPSTEES